MKALKITNNIVTNVALFDNQNDIFDGWVVSPSDDIGISWTDNQDGTFSPPVPPEKTPVEIRNESLNALVYDFGDGRIIQTRPQDESNIRNAIDIMTNDNTIQSLQWRMQDNVVHPVTLAELQTALSSGQLSAMLIWNNYNTGG